MIMSNSPANQTEHHVRLGETLSGIANQHGITLEALLAANPDIENPDRIQINQVIIIPAQAAPEVDDTGAFFLGFDRLGYPGDDFMRLLRARAQVTWTGFYLAPAPSQPNTSWMQKRAFLKGLGYGFAPIYVGQQQTGISGSHTLTASQGTRDAEDAVALAQEAGFPASSVLYLDIENGPPAQSRFLTYYKAWVQGVRANGFSPGVYCSHLLAPKILEQDTGVVVWIFHLKFSNGHSFAPPLPMIDPSQSNFTTARMMQYAQNGKITISSTSLTPIDLNSGHRADPSQV
jgi:LysM repeat protein